MKKNNSLVKDVVNFSFSKPLNLLIVVLLIIGILKDNAKKLPATTNTTQQNNTTIKEVVKEKINKIGQAIEMSEAIKQKQKERISQLLANQLGYLKKEQGSHGLSGNCYFIDRRCNLGF